MIASAIAYAMAAYCLTHTVIFAGAGVSLMIDNGEDTARPWVMSILMAIITGIIAWLFAYLGTVTA